MRLSLIVFAAGVRFYAGRDAGGHPRAAQAINILE
jgi:hypothetical protein